MDSAIAYLLIALAILVFIIVFFSMFPIGLWIEAMASGVHVSIFSMFGMRLRRINPAKIVRPLIQARKAGVEVDRNKLEAHFLAGGNVERVINALISAQSAEIPLEFEKAMAIDRAGRDVLFFENEWSIRLACENNEGLVLAETADRAEADTLD